MLSNFLFLLPIFLYFLFVNGEKENDFYSFTVKDLDGKDFNLEKYRGTVSLVVNVASECGYTDSHYKALVKLQSELSPTGKFQVLAFPCNQFGKQEPHGNKEILKFAQKHYAVNFPIFSKIDVIGDNANYAFATLVGQSGKAPTWNFWKYLVNTEGDVIGAWGPQQTVDSIADIVRQEVAVASNMIIEPGSDDKRIRPEL